MLATRIYLQQTRADDLQPAKEPAFDVSIVRSEEPSPEFHRYLYTAVGGDWYWSKRLRWTWQEWQDFLTTSGHETWVSWVRGTPVGYVLMIPGDGEVEIRDFGLVPSFIGQGLGGHLLTFALRRAWEIAGTSRVWLHTCTLDGPHALANYQARGLSVYHTEEMYEDDGPPPGPWPGASRPSPA
ncbi:GNAT family N-acetyltransferase [Actinocrispum wychmicini]|uniref:Ribosomal protein S18 acetylase RimI-like enzyme n=1 Tax=Actinocrispum wychmicini TaxID=1213861 RepID=A0A4R2JYT7_9PSEU|nr:GNAT family N-acetyltransferase [Actinocrispum wychmicini]TCO64432.1 ribosomal protein S18 acetylase RimI-like enzyme [Actinocrispum wychmicini]